MVWWNRHQHHHHRGAANAFNVKSVLIHCPPLETVVTDIKRSEWVSIFAAKILSCTFPPVGVFPVDQHSRFVEGRVVGVRICSVLFVASDSFVFGVPFYFPLTLSAFSPSVTGCFRLPMPEAEVPPDGKEVTAAVAALWLWYTFSSRGAKGDASTPFAGVWWKGGGWKTKTPTAFSNENKWMWLNEKRALLGLQNLKIIMVAASKRNGRV